MMEWSAYVKLIGGLLAIVNPLGVVPVYLNLTRDYEARDRNRVGLLASLSVLAILIVAMLSGQALMHFFGISISSFRVAGGLLVLLIAGSMLQNQSRFVDTDAESGEKASVAMVPLAIPLLGGPGAITTIIVFAHIDSGIGHYAALAAVVSLVALIVFVVLRLAPLLARVLGKTGMIVMTRVMGLILVAIALEFIAAGLSVLFPGLG